MFHDFFENETELSAEDIAGILMNPKWSANRIAGMLGPSRTGITVEVLPDQDDSCGPNKFEQVDTGWYCLDANLFFEHDSDIPEKLHRAIMQKMPRDHQPCYSTDDLDYKVLERYARLFDYKIDLVELQGQRYSYQFLFVFPQEFDEHPDTDDWEKYFAGDIYGVSVDSEYTRAFIEYGLYGTESVEHSIQHYLTYILEKISSDIITAKINS